MTARWFLPVDPDRLERAALDHEVVAREYEDRARWFRRKADALRAEAQEQPGVKS